MKLIAVEGIDGVGKDTVIDKCIKAITLSGKKAMRVNSITDGTLGKKIRELLKKPKDQIPDGFIMATLFSKELENATKIIKEYQLRYDPDYIFLNRWYYSTLAYSSEDITKNIKEHVDILKTIGMDTNFEDRIAIPDYCIYLTLPIKMVENRLKNRKNKEVEGYETIEFLKHVDANYKKFMVQNNVMMMLRATQPKYERIVHMDPVVHDGIEYPEVDIVEYDPNIPKTKLLTFQTHSIDKSLIDDILGAIGYYGIY